MSSSYIPFTENLGGGAIVRWFYEGASEAQQAEIRGLFTAGVKQFHRKARRATELGTIDLTRKTEVGLFTTMTYWHHQGSEYIDVHVNMAALREAMEQPAATFALEFHRPSREYVSQIYYSPKDDWGTIWDFYDISWFNLYANYDIEETLDEVFIFDWQSLIKNGYNRRSIPILFHLTWWDFPMGYSRTEIGPCFGRCSYHTELVEREHEVTFPNWPVMNYIEQARYWPEAPSYVEHPNWPFDTGPEVIDTGAKVYNSLTPPEYLEQVADSLGKTLLSEAQAQAGLAAVQQIVKYTTIPVSVEDPYWVISWSIPGWTGLAIPVNVGPRIAAAHDVEYWTLSTVFDMPWPPDDVTLQYYQSTIYSDIQYGPLTVKIKRLDDNSQLSRYLAENTDWELRWAAYKAANWVPVSEQSFSFALTIDNTRYWSDRISGISPRQLFGYISQGSYSGDDSLYITIDSTPNGITIDDVRYSFWDGYGFPPDWWVSQQYPPPSS